MDHTLDVKAMNRYKTKPATGREFKELDFGINPTKTTGRMYGHI